MLEVVFIRHAQSLWNAEHRWQGHSDIALSELGQAQARALGQRLASEAFDRLYCSDLLRTQTTARLALPQRELTLDGRLREIHFGEFEGKRYDELTEAEQTRLDAWWKNPYNLALEGGESMRDLSLRMGAFRAELPEEGRVALFTHGGVIRSSLWDITGYPTEGRWSFSLSNTGLTEIHYRNGYARIIRVNDTAHLDNL